MPNYVGTAGSAVALSPGDQIQLFAAESPAAPPQASIAVARGFNPAGGGPTQRVFTISWAAAPTAVLKIQGSNQDIDTQYQTLHTTTNTQLDNYVDYGDFAYYRALLVSQSAGGALTVVMQ